MRRARANRSLVTYKIGSDPEARLKRAARTACNFWNAHVEPARNVVVRLGIEPLEDEYVAVAWEPEVRNDVTYGRIDFSEAWLKTATPIALAGTVIHEMAHVLGFGFGSWRTLFEPGTGRFRNEAVAVCPSLREMIVELEGGDGTALMHWDEKRFGAELMTGWDNCRLHVLPVTVAVMRLLGHDVRRQLSGKTALHKLVAKHAGKVFPSAMKRQAEALERDHLLRTRVRETMRSRER